MCEIQNWLRDNEILTVGELRYRRTGNNRHPRPQVNAWYSWPNKTLYDILARKDIHEPLIDEETFELAQKRMVTRHRPTKIDEIELFSGLLFCADCGYKMYAVRGAGTIALSAELIQATSLPKVSPISDR